MWERVNGNMFADEVKKIEKLDERITLRWT